MIKTNSLLNKLAKKFPKRIAKRHHDYVGLMTGKLPINISKILLCLDFDEEVFEYAKDFKPDIIITHHPFIYGTKYRVFKKDIRKKELCDKIDSLNIPVYSIHTNFDEGIDGMNDALATCLGLKDIKSLINEPMARGGKLKVPQDINEFAKFAKEKLKQDYALLLPYGKKMISTVAIVGGGGSYLWSIAKEEGYDIYISGDVAHHTRRDIINSHYNYLDLPHEVERIFMPQMKKILLDIDKDLDILIVDHEKNALVI